MLKQALLFVTALATAVGCSVSDGPAAVEHRGTAKQAMVGGTTSPSSQDSVVFVMFGQDESCSGTLIAPNLVLTARHCVGEPQGDQECTTYGPTTTPSNMTIKTGASAGWETGTVAAKGKKIFTPDQDSTCGHDVALIMLDRDVPNAKISPVRFTDLKPNEPMVTVGYGVDQNDNELPKRMQRSTTVLGVGPATIPYKMEDGKTFTYNAPDGDVVTGESTCNGDSGGPLFDMNGKVVAMTSRGPLDSPTGGSHGTNGCGDMVSIYASTKMNKDLIMNAAKEAGHPIADDTVEAQSTVPSGDDDDSSATSDDDDDDPSSDDDDDDKPKKKSTKKKSTGAAVQASGCSSAPGETGDAWTMLLGLGLVVISAKRRASRS